MLIDKPFNKKKIIMQITTVSRKFEAMKYKLTAMFATLTLFTISVSLPAQADPLLWEPVQPYENQYQSNDYIGDSLNGFDKRVMSQLLGAAIGGLIGSKIGDGKGQMAATAAGTLIGYMLAGKLMDYMDNSDRQRTYQTLESVQNNHTVAWQNPDTLADYAVTPMKTYKLDDQNCREYITRATIDDHSEEITGTACRQANGNWQIQSY